MYSSTLQLSLSAWVLAIALALDTVSALPVPPAAGNGVVLSPVQRSLPATTAPFLVSRKVRRSTSPLRLVVNDEEPNVIQTFADMRDPRNWIETASSSSMAAPVLARPKRDRVISDSIFSDLFNVAPLDLGSDSEASSLEPNGIHASLAAAMTVRQIEQHQAPPPQTRFAATHRPAAAKAGFTPAANVQVPLRPANESARVIDNLKRMNPAAVAVA